MDNNWQADLRRLVDDIVDMALLKIKPLEHYQYPGWLLALLVTFMGAMDGAMDDTFTGDIAERLVFYIAMSWAELLIMNAFLHWWLQQGERWHGKASLWPLLVVASGINLISPLLSWAEAPYDEIFSFVLAVWGVVILIESISRSLPIARKHVIWGVVLFTPMALMLYVLMQTIGMSLGWLPAQVDVPSP